MQTTLILIDINIIISKNVTLEMFINLTSKELFPINLNIRPRHFQGKSLNKICTCFHHFKISENIRHNYSLNSGTILSLQNLLITILLFTFIFILANVCPDVVHGTS